MQIILHGPSRLRSDIQLFAVLFIIFNVFSMVPFSAYGVSFESGNFSGNVDTTLTYGSSFRVQGVDTRIVGETADPAGLIGSGEATQGTAFSENSDDGNQNFDKGNISSIGKFTTELKLKYNNVGVFTRFNGFRDFQNTSAGDRLELSSKAKRLVGKNVNLQDLYVWADFNVGRMPASIRVGEQVISWGESTFIQNGINVINPFDVSKLRTPGSQVRDALIPVGMVSFSIAPTDALSFEGYYQYDWERTIVEPVGSYFSTNDFVGDGGRKVVLGSGAFSDRGSSFGRLRPAINADLTQIAAVDARAASASASAAAVRAAAAAAVAGAADQAEAAARLARLARLTRAYAAGVGRLAVLAGNSPKTLETLEPDFMGVLRTADKRPENGGEFGFALRYFSEKLNDTEFGLFYIRHHSRTPIISAVTGTGQGVLNASAAAAAITGAQGLALARAGLTAGFAGARIAADLGGPVGGNAYQALFAAAGGGAAGPAAVDAATSRAAEFARSVSVDQYARTANYLIEYPEHIQRIGMSFNTQLPNSGVALQGEYTFTHDAPLQVDDAELLLQALCPLAQLNSAVEKNQLDPGCKKTKAGQYIPGFIERNISQFQMTATQILGPVIGANQGALVGEVGFTHVHNMPKKSNLRLNGAGTFVSGNPFQATAEGLHSGRAAESSKHFADATSWGYRIAARLNYNNLIGPFNVSPRLAFSHDVSGITPGPGGNFLEGRKALTLGVSTDYQNSWQADVSYTSFSGAGRYNLLNDRDFVAFNMSYFF